MKIAMTGGHHSSALPLIDHIRDVSPEADITWFGHRHSMQMDRNTTLEYKQITGLGIPFIDLPAGKFYRTYNPLKLLKIPFGFVVAFFHLVKHRPDVIFSFGGYLAVPVVISGWFLGIPSITHEQTVVVGYANKVIGKFAKKVLISHEESAQFFPVEKTIYSGLPLRTALFEVRSSEFIFDSNLPVLYITAGKTGSHIINELILECLPKLLHQFNVIHQCGDHSLFDDYQRLAERYDHILSEDLGARAQGIYYVRKFIMDDEIGEVFSKANVILARSGAHTTAELKKFGKAAVLVPIPWVSHNEQLLNAQVVENAGLGVILDEKDLSCEVLFSGLEKALALSSNQTGEGVPAYDATPVRIMYEEMMSLI